ncbi:MAG: dihydropteroate synthase [Paracoccaceae bacterium]
MIYYRPILCCDTAARPDDALTLAGGWCWFDRLERLERGKPARIVGLREAPDAWLAALTMPRADLAGLAMTQPRLMGILNVTPDSFSDGGRFLAPEAALAQGRALADGADILDIGGESTRPGAAPVSEADEIGRTAPVIAALRAGGVALPVSIDTRKAAVARAALSAGANMLNDVAALGYDPALAGVAAASGVPVCLMHAQGEPETMQDDPRYDDVLLDVYDFLAERVAAAEAAGIARHRIVVDPGIGFGKTLNHNLALLRGIALFHGLGCPVLLGASRKRFIGTLGQAPEAADRVPGSVAVALAGIAQGVQIVRVHDIRETRQALTLWQAVTMGEGQ